MVDVDLSPYNAAIVGLRKYYTKQDKERQADQISAKI
jgi:hypothetical protein